jgi:S1-C subfamily serine protease
MRKRLVIACAVLILASLQSGCSLGKAEMPAEERKTATKDDNKRELRFPEVESEIKRSVAFVEIRTNNDKILRTGTAFLLDRSGVAATCWHVLFETTQVIPRTLVVPDTSKIWVQFSDRKTIYHAKLVAEQPDRDIVLLQVEIPSDHYDKYGLAPIGFAYVSEIEEGLDVGCTGYELSQKSDTFGREFKWFTTDKGIVSSRQDIGPSENKEYLTQFQISMPITKGASGAPVYRAEDGRLLGMVQSVKGEKLPGGMVNSRLANCIPAWAIAKLYQEYKQRLAIRKY